MGDGARLPLRSCDTSQGLPPSAAGSPTCRARRLTTTPGRGFDGIGSVSRARGFVVYAVDAAPAFVIGRTSQRCI